MPLFAGAIEQQLTALLHKLRSAIDGAGLDLDRLPGWIQGSDVRAGWVGESAIAVFEEAPQPRDSFRFRGEVASDVVVLLDTPKFDPAGICLEARDVPGAIILSGLDWLGDADTGSTMMLTSERPALWDCGYAGYHGPRILFNLFLAVEAIPDTDPVERRLIPFALYLHETDLVSIGNTWERIAVHLLPVLRRLHDSPEGDYYLDRNTRLRSLTRAATPLALSKDSGVIVLGSYHPEEALAELIQVRSRLREMNYDAQLIIDMPELPMMSNEEKVRLWTMVAGFSVMIDRVPSGHIAEYMIAKEQRSILAVLRRIEHASTSMIGDAGLVDVNHIRVFEFTDSPRDVLDGAVSWARELAAERERQYGAAYSWRRGT